MGVIRRASFVDALVSAINVGLAATAEGARALQTTGGLLLTSSDVLLGVAVVSAASARLRFARACSTPPLPRPDTRRLAQPLHDSAFELPYRISLPRIDGNASEPSTGTSTAVPLQAVAAALTAACGGTGLPGACVSAARLQIVADPATALAPSPPATAGGGSGGDGASPGVSGAVVGSVLAATVVVALVVGAFLVASSARRAERARQRAQRRSMAGRPGRRRSSADAYQLPHGRGGGAPTSAVDLGTPADMPTAHSAAAFAAALAGADSGSQGGGGAGYEGFMDGAPTSAARPAPRAFPLAAPTPATDQPGLVWTVLAQQRRDKWARNVLEERHAAALGGRGVAGPARHTTDDGSQHDQDDSLRSMNTTDVERMAVAELGALDSEEEEAELAAHVSSRDERHPGAVSPQSPGADACLPHPFAPDSPTAATSPTPTAPAKVRAQPPARPPVGVLGATAVSPRLPALAPPRTVARRGSVASASSLPPLDGGAARRPSSVPSASARSPSAEGDDCEMVDWDGSLPDVTAQPDGSFRVGAPGASPRAAVASPISGTTATDDTTTRLARLPSMTALDVAPPVGPPARSRLPPLYRNRERMPVRPVRGARASDDSGGGGGAQWSAATATATASASASMGVVDDCRCGGRADCGGACDADGTLVSSRRASLPAASTAPYLNGPH
jgi:hypothetical protein